MSDEHYQQSLLERDSREYLESVRAEPEWTDIEASKAWLEERYPLLEDASLGSPLFRYMKACLKDGEHVWGRAPIFLSSMLSFDEAWRYFGETELRITHDPNKEKLYPSCGASEKVQHDRQSFRSWPEPQYPGDASLGFTQHVQRDSIFYSEHEDEGSDVEDTDSDNFGHQEGAYPNMKPLVHPSRKRSMEEVEDEQSASSPAKKRRTSSDASGDDSLLYSTSTDTPLVATSKKRSIEDLEDAPPTTSIPERKRALPNTGSTPSSPFDPAERSTSGLLPLFYKTLAKDRARGTIPDPAPLSQESPSYEDPTIVIVKPNSTEGSATRSGPQPKATNGGRGPEAMNTHDHPTTHLRDRDVALDSISATQEHGNDAPVPLHPKLQSEHIHVKEYSVEPAAHSEHPKNQTTSQVIHSSDRAEQTAISVVIPLQTPQRGPASNQRLSSNEGKTNFPVIRKQRKRGRKPSTKERKAPHSEPQREQGNRKPRTNGRKNRRSKGKREQQTYVGRLRSGVGKRKHRKPRLVILEFVGRKTVQARAD